MATSSEMENTPRHGGDLAFATMHYGKPADGWLDLSTGINPYPYPPLAITAEQLTRLPDRGDLAKLIGTARRAYAVPADVGLIAVPGSEIAIRLLPFLAPGGPVAILAPTYGSHGEAWRQAGRQVSEVKAIGGVPSDAAIVVVGNPNNPDGRLVTPEALADLAMRLGAKGGFLIVDEAFAGTDPHASLAPRLSGLPALVLRSVGKFYGLAGIRLGFVAGPHTSLDRLATMLGDWPVSGPALAIGQAALADDSWRDAMRVRLNDAALRLRDLLTRRRLAVKGGADLFVLVEDVDAAAIHRGLAAHGIWTRAFASEPTWLRFGLPPDDGFARLDRALTAVR